MVSILFDSSNLINSKSSSKRSRYSIQRIACYAGSSTDSSILLSYWIIPAGSLCSSRRIISIKKIASLVE